MTPGGIESVGKSVPGIEIPQSVVGQPVRYEGGMQHIGIQQIGTQPIEGGDGQFIGVQASADGQIDSPAAPVVLPQRMRQRVVRMAIDDGGVQVPVSGAMEGAEGATTVPAQGVVESQMRDSVHAETFARQQALLAKHTEELTADLPRARDWAARRVESFRERFDREPTYLEHHQMYGEVNLIESAMSVCGTKEELLRPPFDEDLAYRERVKEELPQAIRDAVPAGLPIRFHGAPLAPSREIIKMQAISSSVDRLGVSTSTDGAGEFSVTTPDSVEISVKDYIGIGKDGDCVPLGCLFVMTPGTAEEAAASMHIRNVDFDEEPERLVRVLTSPESLPRVQQWLTDAGVDPGKATEFFAYVDELRELKGRIESGKVDIQDLVSYPLPQ